MQWVYSAQVPKLQQPPHDLRWPHERANGDDFAWHCAKGDQQPQQVGGHGGAEEPHHRKHRGQPHGGGQRRLGRSRYGAGCCAYRFASSAMRPDYGVFTYFDFSLILRGRVSSRCRMRSPLHSDKYQLFLEELNTLRADAGLSQTELAARMQIGQDVVSRCEAGRRRVDVFELALWTHACGTTLEAFVKKLDERIQRHQLPSLL